MPSAPHQRGSTRRVAAVLLALAAGGAAALWLVWQSGAAASAPPLRALEGLADEGEMQELHIPRAVGLPEVESNRVEVSSDLASERPEAPLKTFGDVVITVKARDGHAPVAGATIWTVPSHSEVLTTGPDGRVGFRAEADALLVGVEFARDYLLWNPAREADGTPGEAGSELNQEVPIVPGSTTEIELFVRLGATIRGTLIGADGAPLPRTDFYMAAADGSEWLPGICQRTDDNGVFRMTGLRPNWYLLGPDPFTFDVFPYEHVRADWGSTHEATLQLLAPHQVHFDVVLEGVKDSDAWPLRLYYRILRNDRMEIKATRRRREFPAWRRSRELSDRTTRGPVSLTHELCEGPYLLDIVASGRPPMESQEARWLGSGWRRSLPFTVDARGKATFPEPSPPNRAVIQGVERIAYLRVAVTGARSVIWIQPEGGPGQELLAVGPPNEDENGRRFIQTAVDLTQLDTDRIAFREKVVGEPPRLLETLTLVPGDQEVTLVLLGHQEDAD